MAITSRDLPTTRAHTYSPSFWNNLPSLLSLLALLCAMGAAYLVVGTAVSAGQRWLDDVRYGLPRTTHMSGFVGHDEINGQPTHFIGLNLNRQVVVLQVPGGDVNQVRALPGPYLFGAHQEYTPVDLALRDMDNDGNVDLLITVSEEQIIYLNKDSSFRLPTSAEQQLFAGGNVP